MGWGWRSKYRTSSYSSNFQFIFLCASNALSFIGKAQLRRATLFCDSSYFPSTDSRRAIASFWRKYVQLVRGLSLPRISASRLTGHCYMIEILVLCCRAKISQPTLSKSVLCVIFIVSVIHCVYLKVEHTYGIKFVENWISWVAKVKT